MKKAFLLVGHSNWGKSETLYHLTDRNRKKKYYQIGEEWFFVRRMSNDDDEAKLEKFVDSATKYDCNLVIAFCPTFSPRQKAKKILNTLSKNFSIRSFVLKHKFNNDETITDDEINQLKEYGNISIYRERKEATQMLQASACVNSNKPQL